MRKSMSMIKLITIGSIAIIRFIIMVLFYAPLLVSAGALGGGSFAILGVFFTILTALVIDSFGSVTLYSILVFFIMLPTPTIWPKLLSLILLPLNGIFIDILYSLLGKKKKLFSLLGGFIYNLILGIESIILFFSIDLPFTDNLPDYLIKPVNLSLILLVLSFIGAITGYFTYIFYKKFSNSSVIKRIQK
jgi:hypothetical protein